MGDFLIFMGNLISGAMSVVAYVSVVADDGSLGKVYIAHIILKSRMNREIQVRFCEEQGVKFPLLTRLCAVFHKLPFMHLRKLFSL